MQTTTEPRCPTCGTSLPMTHGFVTWCHSCGWNLSAPEPATDGGRMGAAYAAVGRRLARRMARHLAKAETLEPRITPSKVIAYAIAVATHGVTIGFAISGIALAAVAFPNPFAIGAGILLVGIAVLMRPRLGRVPKEDVVDRSAAPTLHAFTTR